MSTTPSGNGSDWKKLSPAISKKDRSSDEVLAASRRRRQPTRRRTGQMFTDDAPANRTLLDSVSDAMPWRKPKAQAPLDGQEKDQGKMAELEAAEADLPRFLKLRSAIISLAVPILTLAISLRAVASSAALWMIYHRAGFPEDSYGFSTDERMTYGSYGLGYILNFAPSSYLSSLQTEQGSRLFLGSEVQHMTDVKHVLIGGMIFATLYFMLTLFCALPLRARAAGLVRRSVFRGAVLTLVLILVLGVLAGIGWESFFTNFHHLFFPQGNWQFRLSDTLIRLYPPQFWVDAAVTLALILLLLLAVLFILTWPTAARTQREERRRAARARANRSETQSA